MDFVSLSIDPKSKENLAIAQEIVNASWTAMEERARALSVEKRNGEWPERISRGKFTMTKNLFLSEFGDRSIITKVPNDPFGLVDLLEAIYRDRDECCTVWRISRLMLHPEDVDGTEMVYLSDRGGIFSIMDHVRDLDGTPRVVTLKEIIRYFRDRETP